MPTNKALCLKARLRLVTLIALLLSLLPGAMLVRHSMKELEVIQAELRGLPLNEGWQRVLQELQLHRLTAAEALSTRPDARAELAQRQQAVRTALEALRARMDPLRDARHLDALDGLTSAFAGLADGLAKGPMDVPRLLAQHQALAERSFHAIGELNGDTGLLLDPEASSYFSIIAGLQAAPQVADALSGLGSLVRAAAVDDTAAVSAALTRYREHASTMLQHMQAAERLGGELAGQISPMIKQAVEQRRMVDSTMQAAAMDVNYPLEQLSKTLAASATLQSTLTTQVLQAVQDELTRRADSAASTRNVLLVLVPLMLAALGWLMHRAMRQLLEPVQQLVEATERIASGDLSTPVPAGASDELGRLLAAMSHMQDRLRALVENIHRGAGSIRSAANEIASGNDDLANRTEQAAAHLQQTTSSVALLEQAVQASTQAVEQAARLAGQASEVASEGGAVVSRVVSTMEDIHASSQRISEISSLIDGIAFQTNILALNAAVEAARAGDAGRGFAVVAAEVRALAQRSAGAAREIKGLIQQSVERVESGTALAEQAGTSMQRIVSTVQTVGQVIQGISTQARTQSTQAEELGRAVRDIDAATQQNAALVEQAAASAASLRSQADEMDTTVQAFQL